jgi:hypothetical protein
MVHRAKITGVCAAIVTMALAGATTAAAQTTTRAIPRVPSTFASGPPGYNYAESSAIEAVSGFQAFASVTCQVKKGVQTVPFSGGIIDDSGSFDSAINSSWPSSDGWQGYVNNDSGADTDFQVWAICGNAPKGYVQLESTANANPAGEDSGWFFVCTTPGDSILGGGAYSSSGALSVNLQSDYPSGTDTWEIWIDNASASDATVTVYDICAKVNTARTDFQIDSTSSDNPADTQTEVYQQCPSGLVVLGGGLSNSSQSLSVTLNSSLPAVSTYGWSGFENNGSGSDNTVTVHAVCATK